MARASVRKNYLNFIGGKNSDASALTPPENTAKVIKNVTLDKDGSISRRLGLDIQEGAGQSNVSFDVLNVTQDKIDFFEWKNAGNRSGEDYYVIRVGEKVYFFSDTATFEFSEVDLSPFGRTGFSSISSKNIQFSQGKGVLILTGENIFPVYIVCEVTGPLVKNREFNPNKIEIEERDLSGILDDGLPDDEREAGIIIPPGTTPSQIDTSTRRYYNLLNQGWGQDVLFKGVDSGVENEEKDYDLFFEETGVGFPNNLEIPHYGIKADPNKDGEDRFFPENVKQRYFGSAKAPRGKNILKTLEVDRRELVVPLLDYPEPAPNPFPRSSAFYSGRVWYGDIEGKLYFSQILTEIENIGKCYQEQDPTAKDLNELLDTDGGVLPIPQAGSVLKLVEINDSLLVFAEEGVWAVSGGESNFTANSSQVTKVSDSPAAGPDSIVVVESNVLFWSEEGIIVLTPDQVSGRQSAKSISLNRIDSDLEKITLKAKQNSYGYFDRIDKKIYWLYDENIEETSIANTSKYDSAIVYDLTLDAFYDLEFKELQTATPPFVFSAFYDERFKALALGTMLFDESLNGYRITFSSFQSRSLKDWQSVDGVGIDYSSVIEINQQTLGEPSIDKQAIYLTTFYDTRLEDGDLPRGLQMVAKWEWSERAETGRYSNSQQVIKPKRVYGATSQEKPNYDGFGVSFSRLKIRGHGKSLSIRFSSEEGKDFKILGWTLPFVGERN